MTINGRRAFRSDSGKRYLVTDLYKQDLEPGKGYRYYMMVAENANATYRICYNLSLKMLKFSTIKEAQKYVRDWEGIIQTLNL